MSVEERLWISQTSFQHLLAPRKWISIVRLFKNMSCNLLKTLTGSSGGPNYIIQWQIWEVKYNPDCQSQSEGGGGDKGSRTAVWNDWIIPEKVKLKQNIDSYTPMTSHFTINQRRGTPRASVHFSADGWKIRSEAESQTVLVTVFDPVPLPLFPGRLWLSFSTSHVLTPFLHRGASPDDITSPAHFLLVRKASAASVLSSQRKRVTSLTR